MDGEWFVVMGHLRKRQIPPILLAAKVCQGRKLKATPGYIEFAFNSYEQAYRFYSVAQFFTNSIRQPCMCPY